MADRFSPSPRRPSWAWLAALLLWGAALPAAAQQHLPAYNTYLHPPFMQDDAGGLADILTAFLNRELAGRYRFTLAHVPRKRFMAMHADTPDGLDGIGLLLVPEFVGDPARKRFLWSDVVFENHNVLVFRKAELPAASNGHSLAGLHFIGVRGNVYGRYDAMAAAGLIVKHDNSSVQANLRMIAAGRADFTQTSQVVYAELARDPDVARQLAAIREPTTPPFAHRVMLPLSQAALLPALNRAIALLPCHAPWRAAAARYHFPLAACHGPAHG